MTNPEAIKETISQAQMPPETLEQAIARLARLSPVDYERVRKDEAKKLGIERVSVLDSEVDKYKKSAYAMLDESGFFPMVEPWPETVDAGKLLDDIQSLVRFYIVCSTETTIATTLWITFTWFIDQVQVAPIAMITAPEKRCGK